MELKTILMDINVKLDIISRRLDNIEKNCSIETLRRQPSSSENSKLPIFPLQTVEDVKNLEVLLQDESVKKEFVSKNYYISCLRVNDTFVF